MSKSKKVAKKVEGTVVTKGETLTEISSRLTALDETLKASRQSVYDSFVEYLRTAYQIGVALNEVKSLPGISSAGKPKAGEISFASFLSESSWSFASTQMASHYCALARFETSDALIEAITNEANDGGPITSLVDAAKVSRKTLPTPQEIERAKTRPANTSPAKASPAKASPAKASPAKTTVATVERFSFVLFCDWLKSAGAGDVARVRAALEARELELASAKAPKSKATTRKATTRKATTRKATTRKATTRKAA